MRLLYVADGRSPTARNWINRFITPENEVHLVSTSACEPIAGLASLHILPVAFSGAGIQQEDGAPVKGGRIGTLRQLAPLGLRTFIRQWLGPLTFPHALRQLRIILAEIQPDLIHAMRYPYEGIVTALARPAAPLIVSVWGNDFTLHAAANPLIARYTRKALALTTALHTDCQRDLRLARGFGFPTDRPTITLPGAGGVRPEIFHPPASPPPPAPPVIINPRGFRTYIRNDVFFRAIPRVLEAYPQARFLCPAMAHESQAQRWVEQYRIAHAVTLLPVIPQTELADLFRRSHIVVSPATHDGTPNTLLEAIACGCFPVAGDIESIREWFIDGENSRLVDPGDPQALAQAVIAALEDSALRQQAQSINARLIRERAEVEVLMEKVSQFYSEVCGCAS